MNFRLKQILNTLLYVSVILVKRFSAIKATNFCKYKLYILYKNRRKITFLYTTNFKCFLITFLTLSVISNNNDSKTNFLRLTVLIKKFSDKVNPILYKND